MHSGLYLKKKKIAQPLSFCAALSPACVCCPCVPAPLNPVLFKIKAFQHDIICHI